MSDRVEEALRLEDQATVTYTELVAVSGLTEADIRDLVRYGALSPVDSGAPTWTFTARSLTVVRKAGRLRHEFELDTHAVTVVLGYLERIESLEAQLRTLRAQLG
jgi:chaperone modulatory protein CbpM